MRRGKNQGQAGGTHQATGLASVGCPRRPGQWVGVQIESPGLDQTDWDSGQRNWGMRRLAGSLPSRAQAIKCRVPFVKPKFFCYGCFGVPVRHSMGSLHPWQDPMIWAHVQSDKALLTPPSPQRLCLCYLGSRPGLLGEYRVPHI